ncbi:MULTISPECIES: hypothetical protein [unclassified Nocardioides]|uniref:hypothetical protein n=1 Tax=unclassified Nocardioides TaxID=2615069 RepID=UPI0009F08CFD|nr:MULTISPECIES: hypothetical protein [unclassified Nocardioides]GAW50859.1 hypothetical protein PD653B2_3195 [Nocardioides sp. PD653-B2]GAW54017.1 hypothetical protein PD653_1424 [Nocardioides sp. PD653]
MGEVRVRWWRRRSVGFAVAWVGAAALAVTIGVLTVSSVGASIRGQGPLGNDVVRPEGSSRPEPGATRIRDEIEDVFGTFVVECRGVVAYGIATETRDGWRTVSYEPGPDDDVDAVFAKQGSSIELEVYCNQGRPTLGDRESKTLPDED